MFGSSPNVNSDTKNVNHYEQSLSESLVSKMWISQQQNAPSCQYEQRSNTLPHQYDPVESSWSNYAPTPTPSSQQASHSYSYTSVSFARSTVK
jgi:hypothetical protein